MSDKIANEKETRKRILKWAKHIGCLPEAKQILDKYDGLMRMCSNDEERKDIAKLGIVEMHKLLDCYGGLSINGQNIMDATKPDLMNQTIKKV